MRHTAAPLLAACLCACAALAGCAGSDPRPVRPLLDGEHVPDVLTEAALISRPPALGGNRFLTGWWPSREAGEVVLHPQGSRSRLQMVSLGGRPRTLLLDLQGAPATLGSVRVQAAGRDLGSFPVADPTEIPLPGDLPPGRLNVDLAFAPAVAPGVKVLAGALRSVLPAGQVTTKGSDLLQSGESMVELVRRVTPGTVLAGSFVPPASAAAGQRYELTVERPDGPRFRRLAQFTWEPGLLSRLAGRQAIALPLGATDGWVRIRLRAHGAGSPARWAGLGFRGGVKAPAEAKAAAVPTASRPRLVIVYVMDALRADFVGHLGGPPGVSPNLDRLAGEGLSFRQHRSVAPNTLPSTKALFTGRAFVSRGGWKLTAEDGPTLAEQFKGAGFHTGLFSGSVYVSPAYGTERGFEHVAGEVLVDGQPEEGKRFRPFNDNAAQIHAAVLAWLASLPKEERAFLYLHTIHPHNPYDPPEPFRSRFTAGILSTIDGSTQTLADIRQHRREVTDADRRRLRGLYAASLAYNDAELAAFLHGLAAWAPPEETLIAFTADHGEEHFEHGGVLHGYTLYEEQLRIPLTLWAPGRLQPAVVRERTNTLDLHATLLELAALQAPSPGRSLLLLSQARGERRDAVHLASAASVKGGIYSAQHGRWKLIWAPRTGLHWGQGDALGRSFEPEYLFDLEKDPGERVNLAGDGDLEAAWLRERLLAWLQTKRPEGNAPAEAPIDQKTRERLKALGYLN
jgi:arylsulfatase A-like enzyme